MFCAADTEPMVLPEALQLQSALLSRVFLAPIWCAESNLHLRLSISPLVLSPQCKTPPVFVFPPPLAMPGTHPPTTIRLPFRGVSGPIFCAESSRAL